jgi:hypothetical protein
MTPTIYETASTGDSTPIAHFERNVVPLGSAALRPRVAPDPEQRERSVVTRHAPHQPTLALRPGAASNQCDSRRRSNFVPNWSIEGGVRPGHFGTVPEQHSPDGV